MTGPQPWTVALQVDDNERAEIDADGSFNHAMTLVGGIIVALAQLPCGGSITLTVKSAPEAEAWAASGGRCWSSGASGRDTASGRRRSPRRGEQ